jgi:hypothetical protein
MAEPAEVGEGSPEQANEQGIKHKATQDFSVEVCFVFAVFLSLFYH